MKLDNAWMEHLPPPHPRTNDDQMQTEIDGIKRKIENSLIGPALIRKSFEYGEAFLRTKEILETASNLRKSQSTKELTKINEYWSLEHARWLYVRKRAETTYLEYLPGRVHTYRVLASRLTEIVDGSSALDVGCGSGMLPHELRKLGFETSGIDHSHAAIIFANNLSKSEYCYDGNFSQQSFFGCTPVGKEYDIVSNLGSFEHFTEKEQLSCLEFMVCSSKKYVLLAIPNANSHLFDKMQRAEFDLLDSRNVYPEEWCQHQVNFDSLRTQVGAKYVSGGGIHLPPTSLVQASGISEDLLGVSKESRFTNLSSKVGSLVEKELSIQSEKLIRVGWFYFEIWDIEDSDFKLSSRGV